MSDLIGMNFVTQTPVVGTSRVPAAAYTDPVQFEQEREKIFRRAWLRVCRADEVPRPGDYRVLEIPTWGASIIITRGDDGHLNAFLNICRHRGMVLTRCASGNTGGFVCDFHGWTYNLDGTLRSVPGQEYFPRLEADRGSLGARRLAVDSWRGFVFVNWNPTPPWTLTEYLGELGEFVGQHPLERYQHTGSYRLEVNANWKVITEAFLEPYHVATVHRRSLPDAMNAPGNPLGLPNSCRVYGDHRTMAVWGNPAHQPTPAEALMWKHAFALQPGKVEEVPGANPDRSPTWWFDTNIWFPYFSLFVGAGWLLTYDVWPTSVNRTVWDVNTYGLTPTNAGQKLGGDYMKIMLRDALMEDFSTVEQVQKNLETGAMEHLYLSDEMEYFIRHQHWAVQRWLSQP